MDPLEPELRRIISDGVRAAAPGPDAEARGLARLLAALPAPDPGGGSGPGDATPIAAGKLATGLKALLLIVGASAGIAVVASSLAAPGPAPTPETPPRELVAAPPPPILPALSPPPIAAPSEPVRRVRASPRPPAADPLLAETLAVAEADAALARGEPARARELVAAIAREHPRGQLALERTAIDLAARCGIDDPGAGAAAHEFLRTHADAAVAAKVRARCEEKLPGR